MKVLSLFDGMSCGMIALKQLGIPVEKYDAYEIDNYAIKTSMENFPEIEQMGDVFNAKYTPGEYDILMGGSPCTHWSIARSKDREKTASGIGWELFQQYVRALNEAKPRYFIYENNKSMSNDIKESINETFGFEPHLINSSLVSAQNRQRYYWVGELTSDGYRRVELSQPEDRRMVIRDILDTNIENTEIPAINDTVCLNSKSGRAGIENVQPSLQDRIYSINGKHTAVTTGFMPNVAIPVRVMNYELKSVENKESGVIARLEMPKGNHDLVTRVYSENGKSPTLNTCAGGNLEPKVFTKVELLNDVDKNIITHTVKNGMTMIKGKPHPICLEDGEYVVRKLNVSECRRLQTVPDWFVFPVSNSQALKMLGNGWTVDVIAHILRGIKMSDWRTWNIGDKVTYAWDEFDGKGSIEGEVKEKYADHLIIAADGMALWCDDSFADMFKHE